jgi:hypothetical protein
MPRSVNIRLGTTGKAQVKSDFADVAATGTASFTKVGDAAEAQAKRWRRAEETALRDMEAARTRYERAQTKSALLAPSLNPAKLDAYAGINDNVGKAAASSAEVFEAAYRKMEQRAAALVAAIDPVFAAQQRFDREMRTAKGLLDAGALSAERYAQVERQLVTELNSVTVANARTGSSAGALRAAMQGASYQVQDTFTQLSMGANVMQVVAIQGGQLAGQFANIEGKAGAVARFMVGPWGLAITGAALVLGPLVGKIINTNNALDEAVDKLKEDAKQSEVAARAKDVFAKSAEGVEASIRDQAAALAKSAEGEKTAAQQAYDLAGANLKVEISTRQRTAALLEQASAQERVDQIRATAPGQRGENATLSLDVSSTRVSRLQGQLSAQQKLIELAKRNLLGSGVALAAENTRAEFDPIEKINRQYKKKADAATAAASAAAKAGRDTRAALEAELKVIERNRAAAVKAEQDKQRASNETTNQIGRNVSLAEARGIAESIGGRVTSERRSRAEQQRLYDKYVAYKNGSGPWAALAAKPGTSNHETGQALDIAKSGGVTLAKIIAAYRQAGVKLSEALDEGSHYHIAFRKTGEAARQATAERQEAAKKVREAAAAERELEGDLRDVIAAYDPARAAADDYAATLSKIDALVKGGKLAVDEAGGLRMAAYHAEQKRAAEESLATFQKLFGAGDPMAEGVAAGAAQFTAQADEAGEHIEAKLQLVSTALGELRGYGTEFVDTVLSPDTWSSWGNAGRTILGSLKSEFIKLALLNPLKNLINGDKALPTLSSAIGNVGKLFGKNAAGTEYWSGGMTLVGEHGKEMVSLPRGSRVSTAAETRRMFAGNDNGRSSEAHYHFTGNLMTPEFWGMIQQGDAQAAMQGAAGGAQIGQAESQRAGSRRLGRYR